MVVNLMIPRYTPVLRTKAKVLKSSLPLSLKENISHIQSKSSRRHSLLRVVHVSSLDLSLFLTQSWAAYVYKDKEPEPVKTKGLQVVVQAATKVCI